MATLKPTCVFCNKKSEKILSFTQERLNKCAETLNIRKANKFQWSNVKLPSILSDVDGYHSKCLSNFSALKAKYKQSGIYGSEHEPLSKPSTSAVTNENIETNVVPEPTVEESGESMCDDSIIIDTSEDLDDDPDEEIEVGTKKTCIFCNSARKKSKGRWQSLHTCQTESAMEHIKFQATECEEKILLQEIERRLSQGYPILYHTICNVAANNRFRLHVSAQKEKSEWHKIRETGSAAFEEVCSFVEENVIRNKNMYFLDFLRSMYAENLTKDMDAVEKSSQTICTRYLEGRLMKKYPREIAVTEMYKRRIVKPFAALAQDTDFEILRYTHDLESYRKKAKITETLLPHYV